MFNLSVNIGCEESIEVVLQPFEQQFSSSTESATMPRNEADEIHGLLQSSVNIRHARRSSFHFDEVDADEEKGTARTVKFPNLESTKNKMDAIDQKIQKLLKKYNNPQLDSRSLKSASTTTTLDCDSLASVNSSFGDERVPCAKTRAHKFAGIPRRLEIPASIAA